MMMKDENLRLCWGKTTFLPPFSFRTMWTQVVKWKQTVSLRIWKKSGWILNQVVIDWSGNFPTNCFENKDFLRVLPAEATGFPRERPRAPACDEPSRQLFSRASNLLPGSHWSSISIICFSVVALPPFSQPKGILCVCYWLNFCFHLSHFTLSFRPAPTNSFAYPCFMPPLCYHIPQLSKVMCCLGLFS